MSAATLIDILHHRVCKHPDRTAFIWLKDGETERDRVTYGQLWQRAQAIANQLESRAASGDRAVLVYPYEAGLDFIYAFLGCLLAQTIAVPCHPPRSQQGFAEIQARLQDSGAAHLLTTRSLLPKLQSALPSLSGVTVCVTDAIITDAIVPSALVPHAIVPRAIAQSPCPKAIAFLQYTSGSTGQPKGVMVTHAALLHNQQMLAAAFEHDESLIGVGWLPLFHDMGLIGNVLQTLYAGGGCVLMSPIAFVQKPSRWLQAISRYQATTSGGPNFAYDLLCRYVSERQRQALDLSRWSLAFSGAEPVRPATLDRFTDLFQSCGFRRQAFYPCYGMAEATLLIAGGSKRELPVVRTRANQPPIVGCGQVGLGTQIRIVDPETGRSLPDGTIGEIWVAGAGIAAGYWQQPALTAATFDATLSDGTAGWLRTDDLGWLDRAELFVTGRRHDVLVFWGLNQYPQQLEQTVEACHPAFRRNAAVAVPIDGEDQLVILQELDRAAVKRLRAREIVETVRWTLFEQYLVDLYALVLLKPGSLAKTSSGKIQRQRSQQLWQAGELAVIDEWRSIEPLDLPRLIRRNLNPLTHLRRYAAQLRDR